MTIRLRATANPLDPELMYDITDAIESARSILLGLNRDWITKQGDFFVESPINFVTAIIWFLKRYEKGIFCTLPHVIELMFGFSHFVFPVDVSAMVPKWLGAPLFWTYFVGAALIASGFAIIFNIWIKAAAWLLAAMLFLFFLFFHLPDAIQNPSVGYGNEIVRAIICLQFCGIAMVIAVTNGRENKPAV